MKLSSKTKRVLPLFAAAVASCIVFVQCELYTPVFNNPLDPKGTQGVPGSGTSGTTVQSAIAASMVNIPGGTFQMGQVGIAEPVHTVTLSSFKMSKYEITQSQYQVVMGYNPSNFKTNPDAATSPVETVTWFDAVEFCNKLSQADGLQPVYTITSRVPATGYPITAATVTSDWVKNGYRLPTEAQWEYAARGGASDSLMIGQYAWFSDNSGSRTHGVGQKIPNAYGLCDMSGNVWEWSWDWYGTYSSTAQTDPTGPASGSYRVLRSGSWDNLADYCTVSYRSDSGSTFMYSGIGFRVLVP